MIDDLDASMTIQAYLGFSKLYTPATPKSAQWVMHNFKGSKVMVERGGKRGALPIEKLRPGDNLLRIYEIPADKAKLTQVTPRLAAELKARGFKSFLIEEEVQTLHSAAAERKAETIVSVKKLQEKMVEASPVREEAKGAVEDLLDNARAGKVDTKQVIAYVDRICDAGTSEALTAMVSLKQSDQTYAHCVDVASIFQTAYFDMLKLDGRQSVFRDPKEIMLAGFMHDFGKSKVPKDILDSTKRFDRDSKEMNLLQSHPVFGAELLSHMGLPDHIVNMAHYHHCKMDPGMKSSYPPVEYEKVYYETRILALVDVYQALVGKRSYKKSWTPPETIRYLGTLAGVEYPDELYASFLAVMGKYPKSSLVKLSTGAAGFVMNVPTDKTQLDRPQVALALDADGERMTHNDLVDLQVELDLEIVGELDAQDVFGQHAVDVFCELHVA
ncbi:MAG: HD domain-containing protein [bacterium]|nr:HD domain-containing protein [bacterium]